MKLVMDEKLKHRLVGISVILSLGAIFLPAMMKKSSQRMDHNFSVNVELPAKPQAPNVAVNNEEQMFKTVKIAKAQIINTGPEQKDVSAEKENFIAAAPIDEDDSAIPVAEVKPASAPITKPVALALNDAAKNAVKKQIKVAAVKPVKAAKLTKPAVKIAKVQAAPKPVIAKVAPKPAIKRDIYAVQLASFSKLSNAQALVAKLQSKGYKANYVRVTAKNGAIYKVTVGHSPDRNNVVKLKTQLAAAMQLNGFVVNTGVS